MQGAGRQPRFEVRAEILALTSYYLGDLVKVTQIRTSQDMLRKGQQHQLVC